MPFKTEQTHANRLWALQDHILSMYPCAVPVFVKFLAVHYQFVLPFLVATAFLGHRLAGANNTVRNQLFSVQNTIIFTSARDLASGVTQKVSCLRLIQLPISLQNCFAAFRLVWPPKPRRLKIYAITCLIIVFLRRTAIQLAPLRLAHIATVFNAENERDSSALQVAILAYISLQWFPGSDGPLDLLVTYLWTPVRHDIKKEISLAVFMQVQNLGLEFHTRQKKGEILSSLQADTLSELPERVMFHFAPLLADAMIAIVSLAVHFDVNYSIFLAMLSSTYIYLSLKISKKIADKRRKFNDAKTKRSALKNESLESYETIQHFNANQYELDRYSKATVQVQTLEGALVTFVKLLGFFKNTFYKLGFLCLCLSASFGLTDKRGFGHMIFLFTSLEKLQQPLEHFNLIYNSIRSTLVDSEKLLALFQLRPNVTDQSTAVPLDVCNGSIEFRNVSFSYENRLENGPKKLALDNISFRCKPGEKIAIVGESGSGKTTVFNLLYRFYNPQNGSIVVDRQDSQEVTIDSLRKYISIVAQDTFLFHDTLMFNLKYANPDATDDAVYEACRVAGIHEQILEFPDKYDTQVGHRGMRLSGGEKQRVAIARAFLKDTPIILLDEATASLDSNTETQLLSSLNTLFANRTVIIIAHRLSTITTADQILVFHEGRIVERGTHHQLLNREGGRYTNMWSQHIRDGSKS